MLKAVPQSVFSFFFFGMTKRHPVDEDSSENLALN